MTKKRFLQTLALAAALTLGLLAESFNGLSLLALVVLAGVAYSERDALAAFIEGDAAVAAEASAEDRNAA